MILCAAEEYIRSDPPGKGKGKRSARRLAAAELTCLMGSHGVTCHPAELTFPPGAASDRGRSLLSTIAYTVHRDAEKRNHFSFMNKCFNIYSFNFIITQNSLHVPKLNARNSSLYFS